MAYYAKTQQYRGRMVSATLNGTAAPQPTQVAWGDGGHDEDGLPYDIDGTPADYITDRTQLYNELLRTDLFKTYQENENSLTCLGRLDKEELVGYDISEAALLDANGYMIGMITFKPKPKESGVFFDARFKLQF